MSGAARLDASLRWVRESVNTFIFNSPLASVLGCRIAAKTVGCALLTIVRLSKEPLVKALFPF